MFGLRSSVSSFDAKLLLCGSKMFAWWKLRRSWETARKNLRGSRKNKKACDSKVRRLL